MIFLRKTFPVLVGIFLLSVALRLPQLGRPLSKHHEFCTAVSLRILEIWYDNGIERYQFNPVMTYNNEADKHINNFANATGRVKDVSGNFYYVSHPPFAYYFPFYIYKILHYRPDVTSLQIINYFLHFLAAIFVYFTVCLLSFNRARSHLHIPSFIAFSFYVFAPPTLWFQGNVYMSDMAVQTPFVIGVYVVLKMIIRQKFLVPKYILFYCIMLFIMMYTSWLGFFFAAAVVIYSLLHVRQIKEFRVLIWSTIIIGIFTLRLITYQYSLIAGAEAYFSELFHRYLIRGSIGAVNGGFWGFFVSYLKYIKNIIYNYGVNYIIFYLFISSFIFFVFSKKKLKITFTENGYRFIWLSVLPILLMHFFFLNYSEHDFTVLYASLFLSVLVGIFYDKAKKSNSIKIETLNLIYFTAIVVLCIQFTVSNLPGSKNIKGYKYDTEQSIAEQIKNNTNAEQVLFSYEKFEPQVIYYAKRNILYITNEADAFAFLKQRNLQKGAIISVKSNSKVSIKEIESNEQ